MTTPVEKARAAWGAEIPDWVECLAEQCAETSQNKVAVKLSRSASLVSAVLSNRYQGSLEAVEDIVRGVYMRAVVDCPANGEISTNSCRDWMRKALAFSNQNSERVRMYHACRSCPRYLKEGA